MTITEIENMMQNNISNMIYVNQEGQSEMQQLCPYPFLSHLNRNQLASKE